MLKHPECNPFELGESYIKYIYYRAKFEEVCAVGEFELYVYIYIYIYIIYIYIIYIYIFIYIFNSMHSMINEWKFKLLP